MNQNYISLNVLIFLWLFISLNARATCFNDEGELKQSEYNIPKKLLEQIENDIGDSKVVLLGEINHGGGNIFEIKTELVKFLHEEMGFSILAFESGIYDLFKAQQYIDAGMNVAEALDQSLFPIWTNSAEFQPLISYIQENSNTLKIAGFDMQLSGDFAVESLSFELDSFITKYNGNTDIDFELYDNALTYLYNYSSFPDNIYFPTYSKLVKKINNSLKSIIDNQQDSLIKKQGEFLLQCTESVYSLAQNYYRSDPAKLNRETFKAKDNNARDRQMAENLLFIIKQNPNDKIICWGASAHFAANTKALKNDELAEFKAMGSYIKEIETIESYSIAFTSSGGTYAYWYNLNPDTVPVPPKNSLEFELMIADSEYAWVDLASYPKDIFVSTAIEFTPLEGRWRDVFDALFYVKNISPSHAFDDFLSDPDLRIENDTMDYNLVDSTSLVRESTSIAIRNLNKQESFQIITGQILDAESKDPVPYATVQIGHEPYGTSSNQNGYYQIKVPLSMRWDSLCFSSIAYEKKSIKLQGAKSKLINCQLDKANYKLPEINISSKKLSASDIMKKVLKAIPKNYNLKEHNMSFYIKDLLTINDTIYRDDEFAGELFYKKKMYATEYLPYFNEARYSNIEKEIPIVHPIFTEFTPWLYLSYTVKSKPIFFKNKQSDFKFEIDTILDYNETYVYKIRFIRKENKKDEGSVSGFVYINSEDFAFIRLEIKTNSDANLRIKSEADFAKLKNMYITDFSNFEHNIFTTNYIYTFMKSSDGFYYPKETYVTRLIKETDLKLNKTYTSVIINQFYFYNYNTKRSFNKETWDVNEILYPEPDENAIFWKNFVPPMGDNVDELK